MTHEEIAAKLFNYIKDSLYNPASAKLEPSDLPPEYEQLVLGLKQVSAWNKELVRFSLDLSNGDLDTVPPERDNVLTAPLKALQSNLLHLTWQTQEVAKGNYNQRVDFMGDFSDAFNTMVEQLRERQENLEHTLQEISDKNIALENAAEFFKQLVMRIRRVAICYDAKGQIIFRNIAAETLEAFDEELYAQMCGEMSKDDDRSVRQIKLESVETMRWYSLERVTLDWNSEGNVLFLAEDITKEKEVAEAVAKEANEDVLTGLYNRRYIMQVLEKDHEVGKDFALAFIDLNSLKYLNDTFGHVMGDQYIQTMAEKLKHKIPWEHVTARVGGDEFLLVTYGVDKKELDILLEELSTNYYLKLEDGTDYKVTFSYGVVVNDYVSSVSALLRQADELMYEYKFSHKKKLD